MATFKPGDRVRHVSERWTGTVRDVEYKNSPLVDWDSTNGERGAGYTNVSRLEHVSDLDADVQRVPIVGPKPKVEYPRIISPFTFEHGAIFEDSQCEVLKISDWIGETHGGQTVCEFGEFVAEALNEKVNREEAA